MSIFSRHQTDNIFVWAPQRYGKVEKLLWYSTEFNLYMECLIDLSIYLLTLVLLNLDIPCFTNSVDPDQLASEEANWSGSALFAIKYANL